MTGMEGEGGEGRNKNDFFFILCFFILFFVSLYSFLYLTVLFIFFFSYFSLHILYKYICNIKHRTILLLLGALHIKLMWHIIYGTYIAYKAYKVYKAYKANKAY